MLRNSTRSCGDASHQLANQRCWLGSGRSAMIQAIQRSSLLIAGRQRPDGDQDAAKVLDWLARGKLVEGTVGELFPGQLAQDRGCGAFVQPRVDGGGPLSGREGVIEGLQAGRDAAGLAAQQVTQPLPDGAAGAPAGVDPPGLPAAGAGAPEPGIGRVQAAQSGSVLVPPRTRAALPHRKQRAQRCLQASHHGLPVALDT
jgi:hypothetical protein